MRFDKARGLIYDFKQDRYLYGPGVLHDVGNLAGELGRKAVLVHPSFSASRPLIDRVVGALEEAGVAVVGQVKGAAANTPREDVRRIARRLKRLDPEVIVCLGGGSTIDATKAAEVLCTLGGGIDDYLGTGRVTETLQATGNALTPVIALQTAASSAAHLTKYSNITDVSTGQKKLIVDEGIVPERAVFDYEITTTMPPALTADGAWDGLSHSLEVLYGAVGQPHYDQVAEVAEETVRLVLNYVERAMEGPDDIEARSALGYATDLGGYAIMLGGTNGGHLTSFSMVNILSHGRACGIMNPYYTLFFAPAIGEPLRMLGRLFQEEGLTDVDTAGLEGRELATAVARAMMALSRRIGFPTTLREVEGFSREHIQRALRAAKDPQLSMKLQNMPVPLTAEMVEEYMGSVLAAAEAGDLNLIRNVP
jgi:alcohol dehydrogenase